MFVMTISPIANMEEYWREEDDGLSPAHSFRIKTGLRNGRIKSFVGAWRQVWSGLEPRLLMPSDQFRHFSMTDLRKAFVQVSADHFARIVYPAVGARG